ncbi:MAG: Ig-like domain-containing protein, partial [Planctomycetes bacterium]|nr:Ig-like domain-containing protein [Planctomycetota bacterium]
MQPLPPFRAQALVSLFALALGACGGSSSSDFISTTDVGQLLPNPEGGLFFVDLHQNGRARSLRLAETSWARLVDVYDIDANGERGAEPLLVDVPVRPDLVDGSDHALEADALGRTVLVLQHPRGTPAFEGALRRAAQELPSVPPKDDDGGAAGPFPFVPRNAALVLRFDDLLDDRAEVRAGLAEAARVLVGYPPRVRHIARVFFDQGHGGLSAAGFHPTRVVIDVTTSPLEPAPDPLPVNPVGLPASLVTTPLPNVSVRVATREDFGSGVFTVLRNLGGRAIDPLENGPRDAGSPTLDVVRALRSGNSQDLHNGFLLDLIAPSLVGRWAARVQSAVAVPGERGAFVLGLAFDTACAKALAPGELLETGAGFLEVTQPSAFPDGTSGQIDEVHVRARGALVPAASQLLGGAHLWTSLAANPGVAPACFVEVLGAASPAPGAEVPPEARFRLRFDEPMAPESFDPLESLRLFSGAKPSATRTVVGVVSASAEATTFDFEPALPLAHVQGRTERYTLELVAGARGVSDLAGNQPSASLASIEFALGAAAPSLSSGGLSLRFTSPDEYDPRPPALDHPVDSPRAAFPLLLPPLGSQDITPVGPDLRGLFEYDDGSRTQHAAL